MTTPQNADTNWQNAVVSQRLKSGVTTINQSLLSNSTWSDQVTAPTGITDVTETNTLTATNLTFETLSAPVPSADLYFAINDEKVLAVYPTAGDPTSTYPSLIAGINSYPPSPPDVNFQSNVILGSNTFPEKVPPPFYNTAIGYGVGEDVTSMPYSTLIGNKAAQQATGDTNDNVCIGDRVLWKVDADNSYELVAIGNQAVAGEGTQPESTTVVGHHCLSNFYSFAAVALGNRAGSLHSNNQVCHTLIGAGSQVANDIVTESMVIGTNAVGSELDYIMTFGNEATESTSGGARAALGGGATATMNTVGDEGPSNADQYGWWCIKIGAHHYYLPVWQ